MPTTYQIADDAVLSLLADVMALYHPRLQDAGVKVGAIFASNADGAAVKHAGYAVLAAIKPVSLKDRVSKGYDAELVIDEREWHALREEQLAATLDHELSHLDTIDLNPKELAAARAEDQHAPTWKLDDLGRPKLRSVPGDWASSDGFEEVVARHGADAIEFELLSRCKAKADAARAEGERTRESA